MNHVSTRPVEFTDARTLKGIVRMAAALSASDSTEVVATYDHMMGCGHEAKNQGAGENVRDMAQTKGIDGSRALLKHGYPGIPLHFSEKRLDWYAREFVGQRNDYVADIVNTTGRVAQEVVDKWLRRKDFFTKSELFPEAAR